MSLPQELTYNLLQLLYFIGSEPLELEMLSLLLVRFLGFLLALNPFLSYHLDYQSYLSPYSFFHSFYEWAEEI